MIHNHEVPGSIPGPATQERNVYRIEGLRMERGFSVLVLLFFCLYSSLRITQGVCQHCKCTVYFPNSNGFKAGDCKNLLTYGRFSLFLAYMLLFMNALYAA